MTQSAKNKPNEAPPTALRPPEGFDQITGSIDGWWAPPEKGRDAIHGVLVRHFEFEGTQGVTKAFCVKLKAPMNFGVDGVKLDKGQTAAILLRAKLGEIEQYDSGTELFIASYGKESIKNGRTLWSYDVYVKNPKPRKFNKDIADVEF